MNEQPDEYRDSAEYTRGDRVDSICDAFEEAWGGEQRPAIDEFLAEAVALDPEGASLRPVLLRELLLVELHFRAQAGETPTRQDYLDRFAAETEAVREAFAGHESTKTDRPGRTPAASYEIGTRFGDYILQEEIARGGMGVVYKAHQQGLNRTVALKMILSGALSGEEDVRRFHSEAEAAAKLDHPNIVPIHEVGVRDGQHYFSMGYVPGRSLKAVVAEGPLAPHRAAKLMKTIAQAVAYAHGQGIVHRDLKPANVLLDESGEPKVTDFGLAKRIGQDSSLTATGQAIGTPSYMPPEQAAGRISEIGPRSDVYSLGALLYCLLTGRPPFRAADVAETLRQVAEMAPLSPRQLNPDIDRDLETICLECLEKKPEGRYQSAADLAAELGRYLEGRPILARPISRPARLWRWSKRNPVLATVSTATAALLLMLAIGGPLVAIEQARLRGIADLETERAAAERDRAREEVKQQLQTLGAYVETLDKAVLLRDSRFAPLKQELLKDALSNYQRFLATHLDDPWWAPEVALALYRVARISAETLGSSKEDALTAYKEALAVYERLARENLTVVVYQGVLARIHNDIGTLYLETGRPGDALAAHHKALDICERLIREYPTLTEYQSDLATTHNSIGVLFVGTNKRAEALSAYQQALEIRSRLARENPTVGQYQSDLAAILNNIGVLQFKTDKRAEALESWKKTLEILERLTRENRTVTEYQSRLAAIHNNIGAIERRAGKRDEALSIFQKALEIRKRLARENPTVAEHQSNLADSYNSIGLVCSELERPDEALVAYEKALEIRERLARENPKVNEYQSRLARILGNIGGHYIRADRPAEALAAWQKALDIFDRLARENPTVTEFATDLAGNLVNWGQLHETDDSETALASLNRAVSILSDVRKREPQDVKARLFLRLAHETRAKIYDSLQAYEKAAADWEEVAKLTPGNGNGLYIINASMSLARDGRYQDALARADTVSGKIERPNAIYYLAGVYSICASAALEDTSLNEASRRAIVNASAEKSLALLKRAEEVDFFQEKQNRDLLSTDEDLASLRDREDFQDFLKSLDPK